MKEWGVEGPGDKPTYEEILDALQEMVNRDCFIGGQLDSMGSVTYSYAMQMLARAGRLVITKGITSSRILAHWKT